LSSVLISLVALSVLLLAESLRHFELTIHSLAALPGGLGGWYSGSGTDRPHDPVSDDKMCLKLCQQFPER
jgi:hypothetical protein